MPDADLLQYLDRVPALVLVFFRVAGLMLFAPLFGSSRVPRRVKLMLALVMSLSMITGGMPEVVVPDNLIELAMAIAGEILFGLALGIAASTVFVAAQWAGEQIGQQMGFNISEVIDPQFGGGTGVIGELYFFLSLAVFLMIGGHRELVDSVHHSLKLVPPPMLSIDQRVVENIIGAIGSCLILSMRLAAPVLATMLIVDVAMGAIAKTMPQLNVMSAGLSIRSLLGMFIVAAGAVVATLTLQGGIEASLDTVQTLYVR